LGIPKGKPDLLKERSKKMKKLFSISLFVSLLFLLYAQAQAEVPQMINYQGKLTNASGAPVNDTLQVVFTIYADEAGTTPLWTETQTAVEILKGVFNVLLGSVNPISYSVFDGSVRYLAVQVGGDPEITPRKKMVSVAYAYKSFEADTADYARVSMPDADWTINGDTIYHLNGNVGIGTTNPSGKMHVYNADDSIPAFVVSGSGNAIFNLTGVFKVGNSSGEEFCIEPYGIAHMKRESGGYNLTIENPSTWSGQDYGAARFIANGGVYAIRADGKSYFNGNVGIGTTTPQRALHISDVMRLEPRASAPDNPSEGDIYVNSTDHHMYCYLNGAWKQLDN
jgi:hypothetical protein